MKKIVLGFATLGLAATAALATTATANASQPTTHSTQATTAAWVAAEDQSVRSVPWAADLQAAGCSNVRTSFIKVPNQNAQLAPVGTPMTAVSMVAHCPTTMSTTPSATPLALNNKCAMIKGPGEDCVGQETKSGKIYVYASYTYEGPTSTTGHEALGGMLQNPCKPGSLYAKSGSQTLSNTFNYAVAAIPQTVDSDFTATWYNGSTAWGTVCDTF